MDLALNVLTWLAALTAALWVCWRLRRASRKVDSWLAEARQRADARQQSPPTQDDSPPEPSAPPDRPEPTGPPGPPDRPA